MGRLASTIAQLLRGKHKPIYSPHMNTGDFVVVINAKHVRVTGKKSEKKMYYRHTQYPRGLRVTPFSTMIAKHPTRVVQHAVKGMLPHNRLGRQMMRRLKLYPEADHPHEAQVSASIAAADKMEREGVVWIGLPKPVIHRRPRKKKAREPEVVGAAEVTQEADASQGEIEEDTAAGEAATEQQIATTSAVGTVQTEVAVEPEPAKVEAAEGEAEKVALIETEAAEADTPEEEDTEPAEEEARAVDEEASIQQDGQGGADEPKAKKDSE